MPKIAHDACPSGFLLSMVTGSRRFKRHSVRLSPLGLFLAICMSLPLCAQTVSPIFPQRVRPNIPPKPDTNALPGPCSLDGPTLDETLDYINAALASTGEVYPEVAELIGPKTVQNYVVSQDGEYLYLTSWSTEEAFRRGRDVIEPKSYQNWLREPIDRADCRTQGYIASDGRYSVRIPCPEITGRLWQARGNNYSHCATMGGNFRVDEEHGQRLVRAVSHLVALLQQKRKEQHVDRSDPFAKP